MKKDELIWVETEFAEQWKALSEKGATRDHQVAVFNDYLEKVSEGLDEDVAIFTELMLKVRQAFEKAKNEHLTASYELWEGFEEEDRRIDNQIEADL